MQSRTKFVSGILATVVTFGTLVPAQRAIDGHRDRNLDAELLYLPNEKLLTHLTAGLSNIVADVLWIRTIQYAVKEFKNPERKFTWLEHMNTTITRLDPHFEGAYVYGGMLMAAAGEDEKALRFLKTGVEPNPGSWEIPFEIAKVYMHNRRKEPEAPAMVAHYLTMTGERHEYPEVYLEWAKRVQEDDDFRGPSRQIWEDMLANADNEMVRELAKSNLLDIEIEENIRVLEAAVRAYNEQTGASPTSFAVLRTAGYIDRLPRFPQHGTYFIDTDGKVKNTVLLTKLTTRILKRINRKIEIFREIHGRNPKTIEEWDAFDTEYLPPHPLPGHRWAYSAELGRLTSVPNEPA